MISNKSKNLLEQKLPVDEVNEEARIEKLAVPPVTEMHYYFNRKPLISSRMVISGTLLDNNFSNFNRLIGINPGQKKRAYLNVPAELKNKIKEKFPDGVTLLDPFAGSGVITLEAVRLGLNVVALDYNPVAYLIMKGTIEFPLKYGGILNKNTGESKLLSDAKKYAKQVFDNLNEELTKFYPKHGDRNVRAYIISWVVQCPTCGKITPLVNSWLLDRKEKISLSYRIENNELSYSIVKGKNANEGNAHSGHATCLLCANKITNNDIVDDISHNEREIILAVCLDDRTFELPTDKDIEALEAAKRYLKENSVTLSKFIPTETIPEDMATLPVQKYLSYWFKLFNPRQLLVLSTFARETRKVVENLSKEDIEYATAIGVYLSMILTKHIARNYRCNYWDSTYTKTRQAFAYQGINIMWTHAEINPFIKFSGSLVNNTKDVLNGLDFAIDALSMNVLSSTIKPKVEIYNSSLLSWQPIRKFKFVIADPPNYDDIPYPELMQFFQVWHNRTVGDFLAIPAYTSTSEELSVGKGRDKTTFEKRLFIAIKKIFDLIDDDGVLVMFYALSNVDGWKCVLEALRKTGFQVSSTITLMTESHGNVITKGKSSVFHSLVLTARKRQGNQIISNIDLEEEIRKKIELNYESLENIYGRDRTNLMIAASGIAIETITSYKEVTSFSNKTIDYLEKGQGFLMEVFAKRTLDVEHIDPKTLVYIWFRFSPQECIEFSEFNQTLKALGVTKEAIADIYKQDKGGATKGIRLLDFSARDTLEIKGMEPLIAQSIIDAVHIALRAYMRGGVSSARVSVIDSPFGSKAVLNTINALADLYKQKNDYKEGEICKRFLEEWKNVYGGEQKTFK